MPAGIGSRTILSTAANTNGVAAPVRVIYTSTRAGIVSWCSQQRGTPGIPLLEYTHADMDREYHTEKWCAPTCTIQCVHQVGHLDAWRDPQISLAEYKKRNGDGLNQKLLPTF